MHDIFKKKDISNYSIAELCDFIKGCREAIQPDDIRYSDSLAAYETAVLEFCDEWMEYMDSISNNLADKERVEFWWRYRQAIVGCGVRDELYAIRFQSEDSKKYKAKVVFVDRDYFEKELCFSKVTNPTHTEENIKKRYREIRQILKEATPKTYREDVENIIIDAQITKINIYAVKVKGNPVNAVNTFTLNGKLYESHKNYYDDTNDGSSKEYVQSRFSVEEYDSEEFFTKSDVENELGKYHVTPTIYNNYLKSRTENIKKKFYINICYYLSLDDFTANIFLMKHGYNILCSFDQKDLLHRKYFKYGLSFKQAAVLLKRKKISITKQKTIGKEEEMATIEEVFKHLYFNTVDSSSYLPTIRKIIGSIDGHIKNKSQDMEKIKKEISNLDDKLAKVSNATEKKVLREMRTKAKMRYNTQKKRKYQPQSYLGKRCAKAPENQTLEDLKKLMKAFEEWETKLLKK